MTHLKNAKELTLTLEVDNFNVMKWCINGSCAVHNDMRGHTGAGMTMGKGSVHDKSTKQKLNAKSSTELELVGVDDVPPQVSWTNHFMRKQGCDSMETIVMQDNESATLLENDGELSSSDHTKHVNVQCYFVKDCIDRKELCIKFCGTEKMWADFHAKPLQGKKFEEFCNIALNIK